MYAPPAGRRNLHAPLRAHVVVHAEHVDAQPGGGQGQPRRVPLDLADHGFGQRRILGHVHEEPLHAAEPPRPFVHAPRVAEDRVASRVEGGNGRGVDVRLDPRRRLGLDLGRASGRRQGRVHAVQRAFQSAGPMSDPPFIERGARRQPRVQGGRVVAAEAGAKREPAEVRLEVIGVAGGAGLLAELPGDRLAQSGTGPHVERKRDPRRTAAGEQLTQIVDGSVGHNKPTISDLLPNVKLAGWPTGCLAGGLARRALRRSNTAGKPAG